MNRKKSKEDFFLCEIHVTDATIFTIIPWMQRLRCLILRKMDGECRNRRSIYQLITF